MVAHVATVAFLGLEARAVEVQVQVAPGVPAFVVVGLPDKAVAESRERVRAALTAIGLALPPRRITVNLSPADLPKEGSHYDLPIALGLLGAMGVVDAETLAGYLVVGELGLDGRVAAAPGVLLAALHASEHELGLICPAAQGPEAAWAGTIEVLAAPDLLTLLNHFKGTGQLVPPQPGVADQPVIAADLAQVKGQEIAKRALEIAAAGGHNLLMSGPPGAGKSLLAACLSGILPELTPAEALEVSMVASVAGTLQDGRLIRARPFRAPHHSASMAALVGGGARVRPGEVSLAHLGVLFLDELPEFQRAVLDSLRQPLETGECVIARANHRVAYPARIQLVAAMNPCRCGMAGEPGYRCARGPRCQTDYQARISGPLLDRIDLRVDVPAVSAADLIRPARAESSAVVAERVARARAIQRERFERLGVNSITTNAHCPTALVEEVAAPDAAGLALLRDASEKMNFSARAYHRVLKVARTLADLEGAEHVGRLHLAEAISYRMIGERMAQAA